MPRGVVKYASVRDQLARRIQGLPEGERLPAEPELCEQYGVSRITLRRAVDDLIREGLLRREQGRGTFVSRPELPQVFRENLSDRVTGFYRQQVGEGRRVQTRVLSQRVVHAPEVAEILELPPGTPLLRLERLRFVDGHLHQQVETWLDPSQLPGIVEHDFEVGSLFEYLEQDHGIELVRNELAIYVGRAGGEAAAALGVADGTPLLEMTSTVHSASRPVAHGITRHAPDFGEITISLRNA